MAQTQTATQSEGTPGEKNSVAYLINKGQT